MDNNNNSHNRDNNLPPGHRRRSAAVRDGLIDFSGYSTAQLNDLQHRIDRDTHPQDYFNLVGELERRAAAEPEPLAPDGEFPVRFTSFGGIAGWIEALSRRVPLFGPGAVRFEADEIVLRGWQRTWLGVTVSNEIRIDARHVRNAVHDGAWVILESHPDSGFVQRFRFRCASVESAVAALERLPTRHTAEFETHWTRLRDFNEGLRLATPVAWVTPSLVVVNVLIFAALASAAGSVWILDPQLFIRWGANVGSMTINGDWWRLLTATFLHGDIVHLLVNMWVLWSVGRLTERLYGSAAFLLIYVAAGIAGCLSSVVWDPLRNSVGASGAIFGILGALLAFLAHRHTRVPGRLVRAHGPSTIVFVAVSLFSGFQTANVDNAAHVGGLLGGLLFGWMLARPLEPDARALRKVRATSLGALIVGLTVALATWQLSTLRARQSAPERYWVEHGWLIEGQLRVQQTLANMQALGSSGTLSEAQMLHIMKTQVLPFWESADRRLLEEAPSTDKAVQGFADLITDYVRWRHDAIVSGIEGEEENDSTRLADAQLLGQRADRKLARITRLEMKGMAERQSSLLRTSLHRMTLQLMPRRTQECIKSAETLRSEDPRGSVTDGTNARIAAGCAAQHAFSTGDYNALDALLESKNLTDLDDGGSRLSGMLGGLRDLFAQQDDPFEVLAALSRWHQERPDSKGPYLVEALLFQTWAWAARGHGTTSTVSPQGWMFFTQRSEMAAAALEDADTSPDRSPLWYQLQLRGMLDRGADAGDFTVMSDEAIRKYPQYYPLYAQVLRWLMPRWHGSYTAVDEFIESIYQQTVLEQGRQMYARLYLTFADLEGADTDLFTDTHAKWPPMRLGLEELMREHPDSDWIRNHYGRFACMARDAETYRSARREIEGFELQSVWTERHTLEACDKWVAESGDSAEEM